MNAILSLVLATTALLIAAPAFAATEEIEATVGLPPRDYSAAAATTPSPTGRIELSVSSWKPDLVLPSRIANPSAFHTEIPATGISYLLPLHFLSTFSETHASLGFRFAHFSRTAHSNLTPQTPYSFQGEQSVYSNSALLGVMLSPRALQTRVVRAYLSGSVAPTLLLAAGSVIDDARSDLGMLLEASLGMEADLRWTGWKSGSPALFVGLSGAAGSVAESNLSSLAILGGLRVSPDL